MLSLQDIQDSVTTGDCIDKNDKIELVSLLMNAHGINIIYCKNGSNKEHMKYFNEVKDFEEWIISGGVEDE